MCIAVEEVQKFAIKNIVGVLSRAGFFNDVP